MFAHVSVSSLSMKVAPQQASCLLFRVTEDSNVCSLGSMSDVLRDHLKLLRNNAAMLSERKERPVNTANRLPTCTRNTSIIGKN